MSELLTSTWFQQAQSFAIRLAIAGTILTALALLTASLLRRRSESLRYGLLLGSVVALLLLPMLIAVPLVIPADAGESETLLVPIEILPHLMEFDEDAPAAPAPSLAEPLVGAILLAIWTVGVIVGIARLGRALVKQRRVLLAGPWRADFWTDALRDRLAQKLGLRVFPAVHVSPGAPMPVVLGLWRPCIVVPESAAWDQRQWESILLHEGAHIARRDAWALLAQHVALALFWWCPFLYRVHRRLNELREAICDDYALEGPCDAISYAEILVDSADRLVQTKMMPVPLALLDSARGGLEARVKRLLEKEKNPMIPLTMSTKLLAGSLLGMACLLATTATAFSGGQTAPAKKVQIKILVDGKEIDIQDPKILQEIEAAQKQPPFGRGKAWEFEFEFAKPFQAKSDPRIEELAKQAEAIKPGSGEAIRKALQGGARPAMIAPVAPVPPVPPTPGVPAIPPGQFYKKAITVPAGQFKEGKKIIILSVEDGKVKQLSDAEVKKLLDGQRWQFEYEKFMVDPKFFKKAIEVTPKTTPAPPAQSGDVEALRRQLDRINAELQELRKRLDAKK